MCGQVWEPVGQAEQARGWHPLGEEAVLSRILRRQLLLQRGDREEKEKKDKVACFLSFSKSAGVSTHPVWVTQACTCNSGRVRLCPRPGAGRVRWLAEAPRRINSFRRGPCAPPGRRRLRGGDQFGGAKGSWLGRRWRSQPSPLCSQSRAQAQPGGGGGNLAQGSAGVGGGKGGARSELRAGWSESRRREVSPGRSRRT